MDRTKKAKNMFLREPHKIERPQKVYKAQIYSGPVMIYYASGIHFRLGNTHLPVFTYIFKLYNSPQITCFVWRTKRAKIKSINKLVK